VDWLLQTEKEFTQSDDRSYVARNEGVEMDVEFLSPAPGRGTVRGRTLKMSAMVKGQAYLVTLLHPRKAGMISPKGRLDGPAESKIAVAIDHGGRRIKIDFDLERQQVKIAG
jgi:hypothetical protein